MLNRKVSAVLCSTDLVRSQEFYEQKVGLERSPETIANHLLFECGDGTTLLVYGRPGPSKADHTQVRFWSSDVEADVRDLSARGVIFEEYDFPSLKTMTISQQRSASASRLGSKIQTATRSRCSSPSRSSRAALK